METPRAKRGETPIYASEAVFSETGLLTHYSSRSSEEYTFLAQPTLPSLAERAALSSIKNLHELSLLLAEDEEKETEEFLRLEELTKLSKLNCRYNSRNDLEVTVRTDTPENHVDAENPKLKDEQKNSRKISDNQDISPNTAELSENGYKMLLKTKSVKCHMKGADEVHNATMMKTKANERESEEMDEVCDAKKMNTKANGRDLEETDEVGKATKIMTKASEDEVCTTTKMKTNANVSELDKMGEVRNIKMKPKENIRRVSKSKQNAKVIVQRKCIKEVVKQLSKIVSLVLRKIDEYYLLTVLLLVGLLVYIIYILYYDINVYANEELRYMAKMRSANFAGKCFYYIMRICNVPIF